MDEIEQVVANLPEPEYVAFHDLGSLMAIVLGSGQAFHMWLLSPVPGYDGCPLEAIRAGRVYQVLEVQRQQAGPGYNPA